MAVCPTALTALVLVDLGLPFLFEGSHNEKQLVERLSESNRRLGEGREYGSANDFIQGVFDDSFGTLLH